MRASTTSTLACCIVLMFVAAVLTGAEERRQRSSTSSPNAESVIQGWKPMPRQVAEKLIAKYGQPDEVAAQRLIWQGKGRWKHTELVNEDVPHDFRMPHKDYVQGFRFSVPHGDRGDRDRPAGPVGTTGGGR
jgi:hypothetical protein